MLVFASFWVLQPAGLASKERLIAFLPVLERAWLAHKGRAHDYSRERVIVPIQGRRGRRIGLGRAWIFGVCERRLGNASSHIDEDSQLLVNRA